MKTISLARERYEQVLADGSDIHHHLPWLRESAKGNVMEIGVRQGASTAALLAGIEENGGHLWSVDKAVWLCFAEHPDWSFIHADSIKDAEKLKQLLPESLDLLLIDGDHSHAAVLSDLNNYGDRAKVIALHDADNPDYPGVKRAIEEYCAAAERPYYIRHHSFGMGVIL